jgi:hypothetical protein
MMKTWLAVLVLMALLVPQAVQATTQLEDIIYL